MKYPAVFNRSVLITGCSSGIGLVAAGFMRDAGWRVFASARRADDLATLTSAGFNPVRLDLADSESVQDAFGRVMELSGGNLGGLVNNAAFGQAGAMEDINRDALRAQFETNVFGTHQLTRLCIPVFRQAGAGRIVNISSVLGRVTLPMLGCYCASKYALESLSDALRIELRGIGVAVSIIEPGPIVSAFRRNAAMIAGKAIEPGSSRFEAYYRKEFERHGKGSQNINAFTRPPEVVARKIRNALESSRPRIRYPVTIPAYLGAFAARFLPQKLLDYAAARRLTGNC